MKFKNLSLLFTFIILPILFITLLVVLSLSPAPPKVAYTPQKTQLFLINTGKPEDVTIPVTTLPQFAVHLLDEKFNNLWQAHAQERNNSVEVSAQNAKGDTILPINTKFDDAKKQLVLTPEMENRVKPGLYTLSVKIKTVKGEDVTITQDFRWGVIAINTNKGMYQPGDEVHIGMAILDDWGGTKCLNPDGKMIQSAAKIWLTVTSPSGQEQDLTTEDGSIQGSPTCRDRSVTDHPDFLGNVTPTEVGTYKLHIKAQIYTGVEAMDSSFKVSGTKPAFDIERSAFPTRIYPRVTYPVTTTVTPNEDYSGVVTDVVPSSFTITDISEWGQVSTNGAFHTITWNVNLHKGELHTFTYTIKFPPIVPEFYLVGPFHIGTFSEGREWQIASDSLFLLVQEVRNVANAASPFNASFSSGVTSGNLVIMHCFRTTNNAFTTPSSPTSWTRAFSGSGSQRFYQFYHVVSGTMIGLTTFGCTATSSPTTGEMAIDLMEFSGTSTSSVLDKAATARTGRTCNTSSNTTNTIAPVGSDELMVSGSIASANGLTITSYSTIGGSSVGFCDAVTGACSTTGGFSRVGGTDSFASSYGEDIGSGTISNQMQFSANATCANGMAAYKPPLTITQGSFQFFDNINAITPLTTFNNGATAVNSNITLNQPNQQFRLRMLLDVSTNVGPLIQNQADFQLSYATLSGQLTCATASYDAVDNPPTNTDIAFYTNPFATGSGLFISATAGHDPSDSPTYTTALESYYEDTNTGVNGPNPGDVTNDQNVINNSYAGEWDFSLIDNTDDSETKTYCLKLQNGGGTDFDSYTHIPQVTTLNNDVVIRGSPGPTGTMIRGSVGPTGTQIR